MDDQQPGIDQEYMEVIDDITARQARIVERMKSRPE
jgi:hypothetical protein